MDNKNELIHQFFQKVSKTDSCWLWTGSKDAKGYGFFKGKRAHRASYEFFKEELIKGLCVCHTCDNPPCVNPDHLWLGTNHENILDSVKKGRRAQQKKTHCPQGHEYTPGNTGLHKNMRRCRECNRASSLIRNRIKNSIPLDKPVILTHCKRGHEFNDKNTLHLGGKRYCRECNRIKNITYREKKRLEE